MFCPLVGLRAHLPRDVHKGEGRRGGERIGRSRARTIQLGGYEHRSGEGRVRWRLLIEGKNEIAVRFEEVDPFHAHVLVLLDTRLRASMVLELLGFSRIAWFLRVEQVSNWAISGT